MKGIIKAAHGISEYLYRDKRVGSFGGSRGWAQPISVLGTLLSYEAMPIATKH